MSDRNHKLVCDRLESGNVSAESRKIFQMRGEIFTFQQKIELKMKRKKFL